MQITSFNFFLIVVISLGIYWLLPKKIQWCFLLFSSIALYFVYATPHTFVYIIVSVISVYVATTSFEKLQHKSAVNADDKEKLLSKKRKIMILTLLVNVGVLAVLKYTNLGINTLNAISRVLPFRTLDIDTVNWAAPLSISYYTLQLVSYLLDCYWGVAKAYTNPLKLGLYTCYFPQMTTGPISRFSQIGEQLFEEHRFDYDRVMFGIQRVIWGLLKKLVIAERLASIVNPIYADVTRSSGLALGCASAVFVLQLYMDFSGGMDIILGISECFGIYLPDNFRNPFFATTIQEFWQRWHITLGTWLKDYIMYPVLKSKGIGWIRDKIKSKYGKKLAKRIPTYIGMLVLWLAMGIWHGNGWKYIIGEGVWFWLIIVLGEVCGGFLNKITEFFNINTNCFSFKLFQRLRTFIIVSIGLVFFRAESLHSALVVFKRIMMFSSGTMLVGIETYDFKILIVALVIWLVFAIISEKEDVRKILAHQNIWFRWGVYIALLFFVVLCGLYGIEYDDSGFLYQNF